MYLLGTTEESHEKFQVRWLITRLGFEQDSSSWQGVGVTAKQACSVCCFCSGRWAFRERNPVTRPRPCLQANTYLVLTEEAMFLRQLIHTGISPQLAADLSIVTWPEVGTHVPSAWPRSCTSASFMLNGTKCQTCCCMTRGSVLYENSQKKRTWPTRDDINKQEVSGCINEFQKMPHPN
jgi:hypothetical protein